MSAVHTGGRGVVRTAWTPARREPSHRAEMVTQWLCGEVLDVLEGSEDGWLRCRGEDGYEAWCLAGAVRSPGEGPGEGEGEAWPGAAAAVSLGTALLLAETPGTTVLLAETSGPADLPRHLPRGSRVRLRRDGTAELPGGVPVRPADPDALVPVAELPRRFPPEGAALLRTAEAWLGVPYVWGGRTEWGVDCSGLVQAVYRLHGVALPRDSHRQREAGPEVLLAAAARVGKEGPGREGEERGASRAGPRASVGGELEAGLEPGDLVFFAPEGRGVTHVALSAGGGRILHAAASNGCVAFNDLRGTEPLEDRLRRSIVAVTRPLGAAPR